MSEDIQKRTKWLKVPKLIRPVIGAVSITAAGAYLGSGVNVEIGETIQHGVHATNTITDAVQGGPAGYRSAKSLDDHILTQSELSEQQEAIRLLNKRLMETYEQQEKWTDDANSLLVHLGGGLLETNSALKKIIVGAGSIVTDTTTANSAWKSLEDAYSFIYKAAGLGGTNLNNVVKDANGISTNAKALESAGDEFREKLKNQTIFYRAANEFYRAQAKNEDTGENLTSYFEEQFANVPLKTADVNRVYDLFTTQLNAQYATEADTFALHGELAWNTATSESVKQYCSEVEFFADDVDQTRADVGEHVPMPEYKPWTKHLTDALSNGRLMGGLAGFASYCVIGFLSKGSMTDGYNTGVCAPIELVVNPIYHSMKPKNKPNLTE